VEEIESVERSEKRELGNRLDVLLTHLLKRQYSLEARQEGPSWEDTIWEQWRQLVALRQDSSMLRHEAAATWRSIIEPRGGKHAATPSYPMRRFLRRASGVRSMC